MGLLVNDGSSLILGVAAAGESGEGCEEKIAVGDEVGRRYSVGQNVRGAAAVWVIAVGAGSAARSAAVRGYSSETGRYGALRAARGRLKVGRHLSAGSSG